MHKKIVKGKLYYYATVREGKKTRSVYLGKNLEQAAKKQKKLYKNRGQKCERLPKAQKVFWIGIIILTILVVFILSYALGWKEITSLGIDMP